MKRQRKSFDKKHGPSNMHECDGRKEGQAHGGDLNDGEPLVIVADSPHPPSPKFINVKPQDFESCLDSLDSFDVREGCGLGRFLVPENVSMYYPSKMRESL